MNTLELTLSGMTAGYSTDQRFNHRSTNNRPSRSHVIGMICCALGIRRNEEIPEWLNDISVTVDKMTECDRLIDFQTVRHGVTYAGKANRDIVTHREYLTNCRFVVTVEGNDDTISTIEQAIKYPAWQLYLGRRSCVPSHPIGHRPMKMAGMTV